MYNQSKTDKMKTIIATIALIVTVSLGYSQNTLTVKINGLKTNNGTVMVQLYNANQELVQETKAEVSDKTATIKFKNLPTGTFAVQYYHDENSNGKMDTGMFGKPEEGYGYSNDARGFMGPADFQDQILELIGDKTITLKTVL